MLQAAGLGADVFNTDVFLRDSFAQTATDPDFADFMLEDVAASQVVVSAAHRIS